MNKLHVLMLEDRLEDVELTLRELRRSGFTVELEHIDNEHDFVCALDREFDIIIADYNLPQFTGMRALELVRERGQDTPFILLSGTIGEEAAVEMMQRGAADYVMKDRRERLGLSVTRALEQQQLRRDKARADVSLRESEARRAAIFESALGAIITMDRKGKIVDFNRAAEKMFGYTRDQVRGQVMAELIVPPTLRQSHYKGFARYLETGKGAYIDRTVEKTALRADGTEFPIQLTITRVDIEGRPLFTGSILDITERKRQEESLRLFRALIDRSNDAIEVIDPQTYKFIDGNERAWTSLGYTREEFLTLTIPDIDPTVDTSVLANRENLEQSGILVRESAHRRKDGSTFPVEVNIKYVQLDKPYILTVTRDITARKRREEEILRRNRELATLYQIGQELSRLTEPSEILESIFRGIEKVLDNRNLYFALYDEEKQYLSFPLYTINGERREPLGRPVANGISEYVIRTKKTLYVPAALGEKLKELGIAQVGASANSFIAAPMMVGDKVHGVIAIQDYEHDNAFTSLDAELLSTIAAQAAIALENARLFRDTQRRADEFASLYQSANDLSAHTESSALLQTIVDRAAKLLNATGGFIYRYNANQNEFELMITHGPELVRPRILKMGEGIAGRAGESRQPVLVKDYQTWEHRREEFVKQGYRSILAVPMIFGGSLIGALGLNEVGESSRQFTEDDTRLLSLFAAPAASTLENARLYAESQQSLEETQRHLQRVQSLHEIDTAIGGSLDLRVTFNVFLDQVVSQLGVDATDILLFNPHTQILEYAAGRGFRTPALQHTHLRIGDGLAGRAALDRKIIAITNLARDIDGMARSPFILSEGFASYYGVPLIAKGLVNGVLEIFHREPMVPNKEWLDFLETLAGQAAIAIDNSELYGNLQRANIDLALAYDTTLEGWSRALDLRDRETEGHTLRVTDLTMRLARAMGINESDLLHVRRGALLHDIGKMGIPDAILLKPGPLTDDEWMVMHKHPVFAFELLSPIEFLRPALDIPYCHHEKWDGSGYPRGLKGEEIPLAARLFAIVDVWDALSSDRPYRKAWEADKVRQHIREQSGSHFDPKIVDMFLDMMR